jgi:hypothetical protein
VILINKCCRKRAQLGPPLLVKVLAISGNSKHFFISKNEKKQRGHGFPLKERGEKRGRKENAVNRSDCALPVIPMGSTITSLSPICLKMRVWKLRL